MEACYAIYAIRIDGMTFVHYLEDQNQKWASYLTKYVLYYCIMGRGSRPICRVGPKTPQNKLAATVVWKRIIVICSILAT